MIVGISGASGRLGRLAVQAALERIPATDLVATTRSPDALKEFADQGVDVRYSDFDEPASLGPAFAGVERMFMISASNGTGHRYDEHDAAITAAKEAGISRLVFPSMPKVDDPAHPVGLAAQEYRDAEELLAKSTLPYTVLRDAPYSELHVVERFGPAIAAGEMRINTNGGRAAFVSRADVARAALAVVLADEHVGQTYDITGPELLTFEEVAGLLSEISGRTVVYTEVDDETFARETAEAGVPALMVDALTGMGKAVREGYFDVLSQDYRNVTGVEPLSLRSVLEANRDVLVAAAAG